MIFLSHNYQDKAIVEPIAIALSKVFGVENVFYDSWSMQPGEGIIDKMNQGLENCKYFFFLVSKNSLAINMVKLVWQNALYKSTHNQARLIPVKLDDCLMPAILLQTLYVDIFGKGLEFGIRQMIDVINNKNTFQAEYQTYENIRGYIKQVSNDEFELEIKAETFMEPLSKYIVLVKNTQNEISINVKGEILMPTGQTFMPNLNVDGIDCNGFYYYFSRATVPNYPIRISIKKISAVPINFVGIYKTIGEDKVRLIPLIIN